MVTKITDREQGKARQTSAKRLKDTATDDDLWLSLKTMRAVRASWAHRLCGTAIFLTASWYAPPVEEHASASLQALYPALAPRSRDVANG